MEYVVMFNEDKKIVNPFEMECVDCIKDIWDVISKEKEDICRPITCVWIENFSDDNIY